ncbi:family 16 glycoside hydrolase [Planctomicrobium sp. SH668]|uniref:family 16 glycoside hydrolase n=1 Tax=Planctomicrobium sp. SH668 TaxID=3448126 RepID=UPI003F5B9A1A
MRANRIKLSVLALLLISMTQLQADEPGVFETPESAIKNPDFLIQGEYVTAHDAPEKKGIQVVALGNGQFQVVQYLGGLPGAGWNQVAPQILDEEETESVREILANGNFKRVDRKSPTLGQAPPAGAIVLFDGTENSVREHWNAEAKLNPDGFLSGGTSSTDLFQDYQIHIEFRTSFVPTARGQGRGNSGVYHQGRYETQVLDSFGMKGENNETGAIYSVSAPDQNLCFPPLAWQTYDVDFTAARFNEKGEKTADARMTVRLNGVVVQQDKSVPHVTVAAPRNEGPEPGPIYLQDHGNPVSYRNIWVVKRDADKEARRPRIPGWERFLSTGENPAEGGIVLLGELGCAKCHNAEDALASQLLLKQAPILTGVSKRIQAEWMLQFLKDPHAFKPGTTMPDLLAGLTSEDRDQAAEALVSFLGTQGDFKDHAPNLKKISKGEGLFHSIGCVACHAPMNGEAAPESTSIPLVKLDEKYELNSLTEFLKSPHLIRPSGRMPAFRFKNEEAEEIASYLLRDKLQNYTPNLKFQVHFGSWDSLPNFDALKPSEVGECFGFDIGRSGRSDHFAMRFEGFLPHPETDSEVEFGLGSDDGSKLYIDGELVVEVDGVHPVYMQHNRIKLKDQPYHHVRVDYFELAGGEELIVEMKLDGRPTVDLGPLLQLEPVKTDSSEPTSPKITQFQHRPELVEQGRELFLSLGCANCHELKENQAVLKSKLIAKSLKDLRTDSGCLANQAETGDRAKTSPVYDLSPQQIRDLTAQLENRESGSNSDPRAQVSRTLTAFNCLACHVRDEIGGPESARNHFFKTHEMEMGDEGRLPPLLTGVGDKLQDDYLKQVIDQGADNRPYMTTRMPGFRSENLGGFVSNLINLDRPEQAPAVEFAENPQRVKAFGRQLVGNGGLACIKCHNFADKPATGIQAVSVTNMTDRIREDWFRRYLFKPTDYRPGTRMPTGFPDGHAVVKDVFDGDPDKQIASIWEYLEDGELAGIPDGLEAGAIELIPQTEPILYRNFFEGTSPRGIAVGYPEKAHLIWDAGKFSMGWLWHGRFIDASKHWVGRGAGNQRPLGDHVVALDSSMPLAVLASRDAPWPQTDPRTEPGYQFEGYQLNSKGQPIFRYRAPFGTVTDFPEPVPVNEQEGVFDRHLKVLVAEPLTDLYFRAAVGDAIVPIGNGYRVDDRFVVEIRGGGEAFIRESEGKQELIVPLDIKDTKSIEFTESIRW